MTVDLLCLILGLAIGCGAGWFACHYRQKSFRTVPEDKFLSAQAGLNRLNFDLDNLQIELAKAGERRQLLETNLDTAKQELTQERQFNLSLHAELSRERTNRNQMEQTLDQRRDDLRQLQERLTQDFLSLAREVLDEKSKHHDRQNSVQLNTLLQPISLKLQEFKDKIEAQHDRETRELIVLHNKLANLTEARRWNSQDDSTPHIQPLPNPGAEPPPLPPEPDGHSAPPGPSTGEQPIFNPPPSPDLQSPPVPPDNYIDQEGFQTFSRKQQNEWENFLKRTVNKPRRKKRSQES